MGRRPFAAHLVNRLQCRRGNAQGCCTICATRHPHCLPCWNLGLANVIGRLLGNPSFSASAFPAVQHSLKTKRRQKLNLDFAAERSTCRGNGSDVFELDAVRANSYELRGNSGRAARRVKVIRRIADCVLRRNAGRKTYCGAVGGVSINAKTRWFSFLLLQKPIMPLLSHFGDKPPQISKVLCASAGKSTLTRKHGLLPKNQLFCIMPLPY